jgi:hypothetical protein
VFNSQYDHFTRVVSDPVENSIRAAASGPDAGQLLAQWLADAAGLVDQCGGERFDDGFRDRFGELVGDGSYGRRGDD